jgi:hypothetical protein
MYSKWSNLVKSYQELFFLFLVFFKKEILKILRISRKVCEKNKKMHFLPKKMAEILYFFRGDLLGQPFKRSRKREKNLKMANLLKKQFGKQFLWYY